MDQSFDAIIFDCDGTLVDTMETHYLAWRAALDPHGIEFSNMRFYELGGVPTEKIIVILAKEAGVKADVKEIAKAKDNFFWTFSDSLQPVEKVVAVARRYRGVLPMAVATGSSRENAMRELEAIGILDWFDAIVCAEDVKHHKPSPEVFLLAASILAVDPSRCLAYEDTDIGLAAARSAGMRVVDVREK